MPRCVLQMTLKSSCSQTPFPRLSLRGNSEESGLLAPAVCLSAEERGGGEGRRVEGGKDAREEEEEEEAAVLLPSFPSRLSNLSLFVSDFSTVSSHPSPSTPRLPTPQRQHLYRPPNMSVIRDLVIDKALVCLGGAGTHKPLQRGHLSEPVHCVVALDVSRRVTKRQQDGQKCLR